MKSGSLFIPAMLLCVAGAAGCTRMEQPEPAVRTEDAKVFYAETPSSSKTYVDTEGSVYWHEGEYISVFRSVTNEKYQFQGREGEIVNEFHKVGGGATGTLFSKNYAVYPYSESTISSEEGVFSVTLPEVQHYVEDSFGNEASMMVAVTKDSDDDVFYFKNVCGYLVLKIYGGDTIRSIKLTGNNGEKLSGSSTLRASYDSAPEIEMSQDAGTQIVLDCGEEGVETDADSEKYMTFWMVVPPMTFEKGFTVEVTTVQGSKITQSTTKSKAITQNKVTKMAAFECAVDGHHEFTSFSLSDGINTYLPIELSDSKIVIVAPNGGDFSDLAVNFTYKGTRVLHNGEDQISGVSKLDYSASSEPKKFTVLSNDGGSQDYDVFLFDLPVLYIDTPNKQSISSKTVWVENTSLKMFSTDGSVALDVSTSIKGRGNTTWGYPKKPYALKFASSKSVFGIPSDKRWNLMANWADKTLMRNVAAFAISERTKSLEWTPRGGYVELFLNGVHQGNYYLCEHLKISKNRINITEMDTTTDIEGDNLTGGYFLELDNHYDEPYKFRTTLRNLPVLFKNPDEDVKDVQFNYVKDYINNLEACLDDEERLAAREYLSYLDIDSFVDYFIVHELTEYSGPSRPYSSHIYKDRLGVLKAGPIWDFDRDSFYYPVATGFINKNGLWYNYLFKDPLFVARLKAKWNQSRDSYKSADDVIDENAKLLRRSAVYNFQMWPISGSSDNKDEMLPFPDAVARLKTAFNERFNVVNGLINSLVVDYDDHSGNSEDFSGQEDKSGETGFTF